MRVYFDNAATTAVDKRVLDAMLPYFTERFGNTSSIHSFGQDAQQAVDEARLMIANHLQADSREVIFTSGATESNNIAIWGVFNKYAKDKTLHFITSKIEHPSVLEVFKKIKKLGHDVTFLDVNEIGNISIEQLKQAVTDHTVLISVMYANNEVGAVQPVAEIGKLVKQVRAQRSKESLPLFFHTDAVQAMNYLEVNVEEIGCDFLTFSGHKIYAPKGVGVLYVRRGVNVDSLVNGGHHEYNLRPGTLNTPAIVGLGKAVELIKAEKEDNLSKVKSLKEKLFAGLREIPDARFNGLSETQLPNLLHVSLLKAEGESILMMLDIEGIAVSTGSACSSGALEPSHVLTAIGVPVEWTHGSVRISLGKNNTEEEVVEFLRVFKPIVERLRQMAPDIKI
jgi:cysteine desulfurase